MTDIITEIMVEVLEIFGIATKELTRGSASEFLISYLWIFAKACAEKFLRKLAGVADLESALERLDRLTQEEARMALAEVLRMTHDIYDEVKVVDGKVESVQGKVADVGEQMKDMGDKVEDIDDKVKEIHDLFAEALYFVAYVFHFVVSVFHLVQVFINGVRYLYTQPQMRF
jgi:hypothetical protein